ncbi:hypothetical protein CTheo_9121 [Ceratobasidium theobromae]|uniref:Uncharacterized protein n=1 Tax=Ceratobasidium theobromae TaxID=1582974 RepID=A0A5N5Q7N0_9AGAM|nr:hypothetical protein CTheo_9121 [Ceratobasidium theobromae]
MRDAVQNLAQPRATPGVSQLNRVNSRRLHSQGDAVATDEALQSEADEIVRSVYEDDDENDGNIEQSRTYRLVESLGRGCTRLGATSGHSGPNANPGLPPRVSPYSRPLPPKWDQNIPCGTPAGRQPRLTRRVQLTNTLATHP